MSRSRVLGLNSQLLSWNELWASKKHWIPLFTPYKTFQFQFDLRTQAPTKLFTCQSLDSWKRNMEALRLNAIAIDPRNSNPSPVSNSSESKPESAPSTKDDRKHSVLLVYKGHKNCETVKGVNFCGPRSEYVVSGSDCGRIFIWRKKDAELIRVMEADRHVVNCIESHPHIPVLASSGIESDIKVWTSKAAERVTLP